jgi:hypothetical protein
MNIIWKILKLECIPSQNGLDNIIVNVHFKYIGEKLINGITYSGSATEIIALDEPDINNFTPLDNITKEQVISWAENKIDTFALNTYLNNSIESQLKQSLIDVELPFGE